MIEAEHLYARREAVALNLAGDVAAVLRIAVLGKGKATIAVSGGATPKLFFEKLSDMRVPWELVTVTLVDERQVPETSERSNAKLVREALLQDRAEAANFVPLFD